MKLFKFGFISWFGLTVIRLLGHYTWLNVIGPGWPRGYWFRIFPQIIVISIFSYFLIKKYNSYKPLFWMNIGVLWLTFTLMFEFGGGHFIAGESFELLFEGWKFWKGNIWILVLLSHLLMPYITFSIMLRHQNKTNNANSRAKINSNRRDEM